MLSARTVAVQDEVGYQASIVQYNAVDQWIIRGQAAGPFTYLLTTVEQKLTPGRLLLVHGELKAGRGCRPSNLCRLSRRVLRYAGGLWLPQFS